MFEAFVARQEEIKSYCTGKTVSQVIFYRHLDEPRKGWVKKLRLNLNVPIIIINSHFFIVSL